MLLRYYLIPHALNKTNEELNVRQVYLKRNGSKLSIEVTDEVEAVLRETRRAIWSNDAKENYHRYKKYLSKNSEDIIADSQSDILDKLVEAEGKYERHEKLARGLKSLSKEQLKILLLRFKEDKPIKEIAEIYGITYQAVQNRLNKILKKLRKFF